jgi:hypothetical protein
MVVATTAGARADRCKISAVSAIATKPNDPEPMWRFAMTPRGGAMVIGTHDKHELQMLTAKGAPAGKRRAIAWSPEFVHAVVAIHGGFLAIGDVGCGMNQCAAWAWIAADGTATAGEPVQIGHRQLVATNMWHSDDVVHVLAQSPPGEDKPALWIQLAPARDGTVKVTTHDVDLGHTDRVYFLPDGERASLLAFAYGHGKGTTTRWANSDGKSGAVTGWTADLQELAVAPGGKLLAYSDATKTREWVELRLEPDGKLVELQRKPEARALPAPYINDITGDEDTRDGITMYRHSAMGELGKPLLLTSHVHPIPGQVAWADGRLFASYGEIGARTTAIKLATVVCR